MAFVRKKIVKGIEYHYLVESHWIDGKPRQRVICYLGRYATVNAAYKYWQKESKLAGRKTQAAKMLKKLKPYL